MKMLTRTLQCTNLLKQNPTKTTGTGKLVFKYVIPTDPAVELSTDLEKLLNNLNPSEKSCLVAKATFKETTTEKLVSGFFKVPGLFRQLERKELVTPEDELTNTGYAIAVLICRELIQPVSIIRKVDTATINDLTGSEQALLATINILQMVNDSASKQALLALPEMFKVEIDMLRSYDILAADSLEILRKDILTTLIKQSLSLLQPPAPIYRKTDHDTGSELSKYG
jgi:hypothetical protein